MSVISETKKEYSKALSIGIISIMSYLTSYYMRNILSVTTPKMLESNVGFTEETLGLFASVYMLFYAAGQLINGFVGDFVRPRYMVTLGMTVSSLSLIAFPFAPIFILQMLCFALFGFSISMLRGPLMKIISENTIPAHARNICVCFSSASFAGPFIASFLALIFDWRFTFVSAGVITLAVAVAVFIVLTNLERKGTISFNRSERKGMKGIFGLFRIRKFIFYMLIGGLVEAATSSVGFWLPTYFTTELGYNTDTANFIYSVISLIKIITPFIGLYMFKRFGERDIPVLKVTFFAAFVFFALMIFIKIPIISVLLVLFARAFIGFAAAMLWSIYIPSLAKSGAVSSANGVLDCSGYMIASASNALFSFIIGCSDSWNTVLALWALLALVGAVASFVIKDDKQENAAGK